MEQKRREEDEEWGKYGESEMKNGANTARESLKTGAKL
jgi:hypothetical protein